MTEFQRLFLVQACSDFAVFELLQGRNDLHLCHALHYLQMATELLGKAHAWKDGPCAPSHRAFEPFIRSLSTNRKVQKQLGFEGRNANWRHLIRKSASFAQRIEKLAPRTVARQP